MQQSDKSLERARRYVKDVRDFYYHLMTYVLVNALLVVIDLRVSGPNQIAGLDWAFWVILGWGFGVAGHAVSVFFGEHRAQMLHERNEKR